MMNVHLDAYENSDKCVLHCEKDNIYRHLEHHSFYNTLNNHLRGKMKNNKTEITNTKNYNIFLLEIKEQIKTSQTRAINSVNRELIMLYFNVGKILDKKQQEEGWGAKVIEKLSIDLKNELSNIKGFSRRNMILMVQFYKEYRDIENVQLSVAQFVSSLPTIEMIENEFLKIEKGQNRC